ncbi:TM0106 family RecB-like putative nuclease [Geitlerinema sp. PCC 9228]|jgi:uncharacterized protein|uniref:TM0106 family RecB-like putative nuclease n=1 Tax=Geitlerinema sp. PCC 9228 TaxID=111611 RepID=UPI0008F9BA6A|nr:TM0106 family RecB-like putative nuclease [Geitlerinema sp. PCC 9228]
MLTDDLLVDYQRCSRRSFLNLYGDRNSLDSENEWVRRLQKASQKHRQEHVRAMSAVRPVYPDGDWWAGADATVALMRQGVERIYGGIILWQASTASPLAGCPDVLIKQPGPSIFGEWYYVPLEIKYSRRPKREYRTILAYQVSILDAIQQTAIDEAWLLLRDRGYYRVAVRRWLPQVRELVDACLASLNQSQVPEVFMARYPCDTCRWYSSCYAVASQSRHLSLVPGVTPKRYQYLKTLNISTLERLATANPETIAPCLEETAGKNPAAATQVAASIVRQAQSILHQQPISLPSVPGFHPSHFPHAPVEFYFDVEAEPERDLIFLHGVLVVNTQTNTETFHACIAKTPAEEGDCWQQFLELAWRYPQAPIFHFCEYEVQIIKKLAKRYHTPVQWWSPLVERCVDVHKWVTKTVVLPVESYALKAIARWMGFDWRANQANGAQCICWYDRWLELGDREALDAIVRYNEDDCRATYVVASWLRRFWYSTNQNASIEGEEVG